MLTSERHRTNTKDGIYCDALQMEASRCRVMDCNYAAHKAPAYNLNNSTTTTIADPWWIHLPICSEIKQSAQLLRFQNVHFVRRPPSWICPEKHFHNLRTPEIHNELDHHHCQFVDDALTNRKQLVPGCCSFRRQYAWRTRRSIAWYGCCTVKPALAITSNNSVVYKRNNR